MCDPNWVTIYIHSEKNTPLTVRRIDKVKEVFLGKGLNETDLAFVDVAPYPDIAGWLELQGRGKIEYPLVFIGDVWVGYLDDVLKAEKTEILCKYLEDNAPISFESSENLKNPVSIDVESEFEVLGEADVEEQTKKQELNEENLRPDENVSELPVFRTNWWWREQKRLIRFESTVFSRVDPKTNSLRASFDYSDIKQITVDGTTATIRFWNSSTELQCLRLADERTCGLFVQMLQHKARNVGNNVIVSRSGSIWRRC